MNILQGLNTQTTYCVTLNSADLVDESQICMRFNYAHPVYSDESVAAQAQWSKISGSDRVHYCGAYWSAGFHEDGVKKRFNGLSAAGSGICGITHYAKV